MKPAVILLSGGLDSTTTLAHAQSLGFDPLPLTILYGQRNKVELLAAKRVATFFGSKVHKIVDLDLRLFGGSSLTDNIEVLPHDQQIVGEIPNTYVPARNTIMLSLALAYAEVSGAFDIFYGANVHDYSGYPDCRPVYVKAFETMANLAIKSANDQTRMHIHTPLMNLTKAEIVKIGVGLGVDYSITHSCYDPLAEGACGKCSSCFYRRKGFLDAGIVDPTRYATSTRNQVTVL
jgi:7-cyano-7-deazaguanine synthase